MEYIYIYPPLYIPHIVPSLFFSFFSFSSFFYYQPSHNMILMGVMFTGLPTTAILRVLPCLR